MSVLNLKFFDDGNGTWGVRVPQHAKATQQQSKCFAFSCVNLGLYASNPMKDADRCVGLSELLLPPTKGKEPIVFVALLDVAVAMYDTLLQQAWVRKNFAITDLHSSRHSVAVLGGDIVESDVGCVFLVRHGTHVDFTESLAKQVTAFGPPRPLTVLHMRAYQGSSCVFVACTLDPAMDPARKADHLQAVIHKLDPADTVIIAGNFYQHENATLAAAARSEINLVKESASFAEANELCPEPCGAIREFESALWVRVSNKLVPTSAAPLAPNPDTGTLLFRSGSVVSFVPRGSSATTTAAAAAAAAPASAAAAATSSSAPPTVSPGGSTPVATATPPPQGGAFNIPQPRSAGSKKTDSPATQTTPSHAATEAAAAHAAASHGHDSAGGFPAAPANAQTAGGGKRRGGAEVTVSKWQNHNVIPLRGKERSLTSDEAAYDLSSRFNSVKEAVEALKTGALPWSADYCVVGGVVLAAEGATSDFRGFKKYVQTNPPPRIGAAASGASSAAAANSNNSGGASGNSAGHGGGVASGSHHHDAQNVATLLVNAKKVSASPTPAPEPAQEETASPPRVVQRMPAGPVQRPRFWAETCVALVFQVTPIEMRFDITQHVGVAKNNLRTALQRLNKQVTDPRTKPDPLHEYGYDYALLYSSEKQGYWLLAAADRPCDIVACRQSAFVRVESS